MLVGVVGWIDLRKRQDRIDVRAGDDAPDSHRDEVRAGPDAVALPFGDARVGAKVCALGRGPGEGNTQRLAWAE